MFAVGVSVIAGEVIRARVSSGTRVKVRIRAKLRAAVSARHMVGARLGLAPGSV